jgi:dTDP-4-amino-4,6-dideoxygalactose transaminase
VESIDINNVIRLSKSCLGGAEKQAVMGVIDREFLGMGVEVQQFEKALTEFFGRPAVCVSTGTAALHLALQAAGVSIGDEVLVQSLTYVASFQAISATGAKPVACDIDPETLCLDWKDAEKRLTSKTKAIMPVHYAGGVGALDEIYAFAEKYGLRVIEDAAHAFGSTYQGKKVGGFGDISCFSFDGIKNITSGEGGCIVTDDKEILQKVRNGRLLGVENDTDKRYSGQRSWGFDVKDQGWRYHMSNLMAVIGQAQLENFNMVAVQRRRLGQIYNQRLANIVGITPVLGELSTVVPHIYVIRINGLKERNSLRQAMQEQSIETGIHYFPNHRLTLYRSEMLHSLPVTKSVYSEILTLPLHPDLLEDDINRVVDILLDCLHDIRFFKE